MCCRYQRSCWRPIKAGGCKAHFKARAKTLLQERTLCASSCDAATMRRPSRTGCAPASYGAVLADAGAELAGAGTDDAAAGNGEQQGQGSGAERTRAAFVEQFSLG